MKRNYFFVSVYYTVGKESGMESFFMKSPLSFPSRESIIDWAQDVYPQLQEAHITPVCIQPVTDQQIFDYNSSLAENGKYH
ncbi:hypothetical protein GXP67_11615 [Rhodocytophaga rosea]|uniref:Uncharacterized protein n=1 Tax=Rhodocytophaga rosea TaxID=2704465 RepID=A0A6C0GHQ5_9BACT|nr:hypothetical protein [Rhodocytophaga rosea]QHT67240.1 hypothetical protein GXP67_11615 [Rhodocytophaga rosea]